MENSKKEVDAYNKSQIPTEIKNNKEVALMMMGLFFLLLLMSTFI